MASATHVFGAELSSADLPSGLAACRENFDAKVRVACYDQLADLVAGKGTGDTGESLELTGRGSGVTQRIAMAGPWSLTWETDDYAMSFELLTEAESLIRSVGLQMTPGSGEAEGFKAGTYRIRVGGSGNWRLKATPD